MLEKQYNKIAGNKVVTNLCAVVVFVGGGGVLWVFFFFFFARMQPAACFPH